MERVSVIIPTYHGTQYLKRSIDSVLEQTYKNIEIIVVDDNGVGTKESEKTKNIIEEYKNRIKYISHERNLNGSAARNSGMRVSTGKYICFLDDDDLMLPNRVELCVKKLEDNKIYDGVFVDILCTDENLLPQKIVAMSKEGNCLKDIMLNHMFFGTGSNMFLTKKACDEIGIFDERFTRNQDIEYMIRFYKKYVTTFIPEVLVVKAKNGINNIPSYTKLKEVKKLYYTKFKNEIDSLTEEEKETFYRQQEKELFFSNLNNIKLKELKYANIKSFKSFIIVVFYKLKLNNTFLFDFINYFRKKEKYRAVKKTLSLNVIEFLEQRKSRQNL